MKTIAFFDVEPWEAAFFRKKFRGHKLSFSGKQLGEKDIPKMKKADALVVFIYSKIGAKALTRLPKLRFIATLSTGYDHIDTAACKRRGITVSNVPEYGSNTVAEHTFALLLSLSRRIPQSIERTKKGDFSLEGLRGWDLAGKTIGIIGLGRIGLHVARIAKGLEMKILAYDPGAPKEKAEAVGAQLATLKKLLSKSDVVTLHCPLNGKTRHLLNAKTFRWLKEGAVLVNTARGGLIETEALLRALKEKRLSAAALDVLEEEGSIREEKELLHEAFKKTGNIKTALQQHALLTQDNVIVTPHNAFNSGEALWRIAETTAENLEAFFAGKPKNTV